MQVKNNPFNKFSYDNLLSKIIICVVGFIAFFAVGSLYLNSYANSVVVMLFFAMVFSICLALLLFEKVIYSNNSLIFAVILIFLAIVLRISNIGFTSNDYVNCLNPWVLQFSEMGTGGIANNFTNYNYPYLYLLWFLGKFPAGNLYIIKFVSIIFDIALAYGALKLVSIFSNDKKIRLLAFVSVFLLPTVVLNGAWWAQCDSIFTAFGVFALLFSLKQKPWLAGVAAGLSLAFKLQAVFILPIVVVLLIARKVRFKHCIAVVATYLIAMLPALFVGAPISSLITTYMNTADTFSSLNLNSASIFSFIPHDVITGSSLELEIGFSETLINILAKSGIAAAFIMLGVLYFVAFKNKEKLTDSVILLMMFVVSAGIPFLLPHMHDRYFFVGEVFAVVIALALYKTDRTLVAVPLLMQFAAYSPYNTFLVLGLPIVRLELSTIAVAASLIIVSLSIRRQLKTKEI